MSRPFMERLYEIHSQISRRNFPNCFSLAKSLEVNRKTIQRDISFMRDRLGMPIERDGSRNGYYYTREVKDLPIATATTGDLAALYLARTTLAAIEGTVLAERMRGVFATLTKAIEDQVRFSWSDLDRAFSTKAPMPTVSQIKLFEKLAEAVLDNREVSFRYLKLSADSAETRRLQPYHLTQVEGAWYVIGHDLDREDLRTFALSRMSSLKTTARSFGKPEDFDGPAYVARSFGIWSDPSGGELQTVRVELSGYAARVAQERRWHPTQEVDLLNKSGSRVEVRFQVNRLEEVVRWVLSWGSKAKVLAPPELRRLTKEEIDRMHDAPDD